MRWSNNVPREEAERDEENRKDNKFSDFAGLLFGVLAKCEPYWWVKDFEAADIDQSDLISNHVFGKIDDHIMAVGRYYNENNTVFIGRIAIEKRFRNKGYARKLMIFILNNIKKEFPNLKVVLSAQEYLINFYHSLGFRKQGNIYLEDGIPHLKMIYFN